MKNIIFIALLMVGFASCDTPSTAAGETKADSSAMNSTPVDSTSKMSKDTSMMKSDTSTMKKDTTIKP